MSLEAFEVTAAVLVVLAGVGIGWLIGDALFRRYHR